MTEPGLLEQFREKAQSEGHEYPLHLTPDTDGCLSNSPRYLHPDAGCGRYLARLSSAVCSAPCYEILSA